MRVFGRSLFAALAAALLLPAAALAGHGLDHPAPPFQPQGFPNPVFQSGGDGADWELLSSIPTGNPHTDIDFFSSGGEIYVSAGTLAAGPNGGGQTIARLTTGGGSEVAPEVVSQAPTASCLSDPSQATGLQHDVEATPKGGVILNTFNPLAVQRDAQLVIDATDNPGRCHDQGDLGIAGAPAGGLEIIDVTDPAAPVTLALTSHIGEAHTVNIDPKRPHIAYAVTSDDTTVTNGKRDNEIAGNSNQADLDGFEVVDLSSCMNFPAGTSLDDKRARCAPQVWRYRWPTVAMAAGTDDQGRVFGCHELEVYPDDRLTCAAGAALMVFDMSGAFDDRGTPDDYSDDVPRGTPLPCRRRESTSAGPFTTTALVTDCVSGGTQGTLDLRIPNWLEIGAPSLAGVRHLGTVHHQGGHPSTATDPEITYDSTEDLAFNHESELSQSGNLLLATDERGGGVTPPGASCVEGGDNLMGNGGVHAFHAGALATGGPPPTQEAWKAYANTPEGGKAIYRAPVRTGAQATVCTAHVMQQIPGQNRIFMAWYSQGTQVLDFTENPDGTVTWKEAAYFIPASANEWVSHVFKAQENADGTFTYWGVAADFRLTESGRNTLDVYRVTLPAPPKPADGPGVLPERLRGRPVRDPQTGLTVIAGPQAGAPACVATRSITSASVRRAGRRLAFAFRATAPVTIDLFQHARGGRVTGERLVRRFANVNGAVRWNGRDRNGRRLTDGYYVVRFAAETKAGTVYERRIALVRRNGRFSRLKGYERQDGCGLLRRFKLFRPVFGGRPSRPLTIAFRLASAADVSLVVRRRGGAVVKRFAARRYAGGVVHRRRLGAGLARRLRRGPYSVTIVVRHGGQIVTSTLRATRV